MKKHSRFKIARNFLIFWTLFIGIGAAAGASAMLIDPTGGLMEMDDALGIKHTQLNSIQCRKGAYK